MSSSYSIINSSFLLINDKLPHSGKFNMEFDIWLFELVTKHSFQNVIRVYDWKEPVITHGRAQKIEKDIDRITCERDKIEIVKRPTGGRAILHSNEVTFSMVFNPNTLKPYDFKHSFLFAADSVIQTFKDFKINAEISLRPSKYQEKSLCFQSIAQYEIVDENKKKLAGIAQYFTSKGVLIQGSIPVKENPGYNKYFKIKKGGIITNQLIEQNFSKTRVKKSLLKGFEKMLIVKDLW